MQELLNFDVAIEPLADGYRTRVVASPAGETQADFALPFTDKDLTILILEVVGSIGRIRRNVRRIQSPERKMLEDFGGQLFQAVFPDPVRDCLGRSLHEAKSAGAGLRIRLRLPPALANIPWEYLYDPEYYFVSLSPETVLVRYMEMPAPVSPLPVSPPLRVLAMISAPADVPELQGEEEWDKLTGALGDLVGRGMVEVDRLEAGSLAALQRPLRLQEYHVLHFVGHGGYDEEVQDGALALEGADGRTRLVTGRDLGMMLRGHRSLRLVVLNACEGARSARDDPFGGVAQALVRQGIPAVIAMQFEISDPAALTFSQSFYQAIADGLPVDASVVEARRAMFADGNEIEWATPVLYLRAPDGRVFTKVAEPKPPPKPSPAPPRSPVPSDRRAGGEASAHADSGDSLYKQHRYADAEAAYRTALTLDPHVAAAHAGLGRALHGQRRFVEAETACREAIRLGPSLAVAHSSLGLALDGSKRFAEAEAACREAIRLDPASADAHAILGGVLVGSKRLAEAEDACREAVRLDPASADAHACLGAVFAESGRLAEAEAACREAIRLDPASADAHAWLGAVFGASGRFAEAEAACREAIRLDPASADAHACLGVVLVESNRLTEAEAQYREAIRLDPASAGVRNALGAMLSRLKRYPEAEAAYREAIRLDPGLAIAHANLGGVLVGSKRFAEAEAACREAIRLDPGLAIAHANLGWVLIESNRLAEAEAQYREAIRLDPASAGALNGLGAVLSRLKRYPEAEAAYREAIRLNPGLAIAHNGLGAVLSGLKRYPEAEAAYREAARLDPKYQSRATKAKVTRWLNW